MIVHCTVRAPALPYKISTTWYCTVHGSSSTWQQDNSLRLWACWKDCSRAIRTLAPADLLARMRPHIAASLSFHEQMFAWPHDRCPATQLKADVACRCLPALQTACQTAQGGTSFSSMSCGESGARSASWQPHKQGCWPIWAAGIVDIVTRRRRGQVQYCAAACNGLPDGDERRRDKTKT